MRPHRTDPVSLAFGLLFLGIAGWWGLTRFVHVGIEPGGWIIAVILLVMGTVGLVGALRRRGDPGP